MPNLELDMQMHPVDNCPCAKFPEWGQVEDPYWDQGIEAVEELETFFAFPPIDEFILPLKRKAPSDTRTNSVESMEVFEKKQRSDSTDSNLTSATGIVAGDADNGKTAVPQLASSVSVDPTGVNVSQATATSSQDVYNNIQLTELDSYSPKDVMDFHLTFFDEEDEMGYSENNVAGNTSKLVGANSQFMAIRPANDTNCAQQKGQINDDVESGEKCSAQEKEAYAVFLQQFHTRQRGETLEMDIKTVYDATRTFRYGRTSFYRTPFSWKQAMDKKHSDQLHETAKNTEEGILKTFETPKHSPPCYYCQPIDAESLFGPKMRGVKLNICDVNSFPMQTFRNALKKYNKVQGPSLETARSLDPMWVYEYNPSSHGYLPSLSRFPRYPQTQEEWIQCYQYKFQVWVQAQTKSGRTIATLDQDNELTPDRETMLKEIEEALADTTNLRSRNKSSRTRFVFVPPQRGVLGADIEVDVDEKECHCPYCPMDPKNPSRNFYHRKKSAYRGHIMNTHGIFDDGTPMTLPPKTLSLWEFDDKGKQWRNYPAGQCAQCGLYIKLTNKNHGLLGYLRHMSGHKRLKNKNIPPQEPLPDRLDLQL